MAAVEEESDYREFVDRWKIGVSIPAGDGAALFEAVVRVVDNEEFTVNIAQNARACLEEVFDVRRAVECLINAIGAIPSRR